MLSFSQSTPAGGSRLVESCGVQWGLLGRVMSPRGVAIMATDGLPNGRTENDLTVATAVSMPPICLTKIALRNRIAYHAL